MIDQHTLTFRSLTNKHRKRCEKCEAGGDHIGSLVPERDEDNSVG